MGKSRGGGPVPDFLRIKSMRQQNQRKQNGYLKRREANGRQTGSVMTCCTVIALADLYNLGPKRLTDFVADVGKTNAQYKEIWKNAGEEAARQWLAKQVGGLTEGYVLPTLAKPATDTHTWNTLRDTMLINVQRSNGAYAMETCLAALRAKWGYGEKRLRAVMREADANYRQFLQWAVDGRGDDDAPDDATGQDYAYEKLTEKMRQILHDESFAVDAGPGERAVFVEKL